MCAREREERQGDRGNIKGGCLIEKESELRNPSVIVCGCIGGLVGGWMRERENV